MSNHVKVNRIEESWETEQRQNHLYQSIIYVYKFQLHAKGDLNVYTSNVSVCLLLVSFVNVNL